MTTVRLLLLTVFASSIVGCGFSEKKVQATNESEGKDILFADPTIIQNQGKYYLTGTGNNVSEGFTVMESVDLKKWYLSDNPYILKKNDHTFGETGFWAPQWFSFNNMNYLTYTANEQTVLAKSLNLLRPFRQDTVKPIDASEKNIDSFLFKDDDGKCYLYHVRFNKGNYIWVCEFDVEKGEIIPGTLKQCLTCTEPWESTSNYVSDPIMEGPSVIKIDGVYYLFYSANHFMNIDYAVGYATSSSPLGPWKKYKNNPILHRSIVGENGSGHGDIFKNTKGNYYYVYHVHNSDSCVFPRKTRIVPLKMKKNSEGIYDISVSKNEVIKPYQY